jgi:hypothetical protein
MTLAPQVAQLSKVRESVTVSDSSLSMGTVIPAGKGAGKTTLLGELSCQVFQKGYPQVLFDPLGTLAPAFLFRAVRFLQHVPQALHRRFWERIRYVDLGARDVVTPFPIYYSGTGYSLYEVAERFLNVLEISNPALVTTAPISWPQMRRLGVYTGMVLASLGLQLTEARSLLFTTLQWEQSGKFAAAIRRCPEAAEAVAYFREEYLPLSRTEKGRVRSSFLDHIFPLTVAPQLRAVFCASTPGIDWQDVEQKGQTVILDFRNVRNPQTKRFAMLWVFVTLYEFLKQRGRKDFPFGLMIDEFAALTQQVTSGENPLALMLDEFINQYMRNNQIWFTCAFQSLNQLDEHLRNTVLSLGTYCIGKSANMEEARVLADALSTHNPYRVKRYHNVWGKMDLPPVRPGRITFDDNEAGYFVLEREPQYMELAEQLELSAQKINHLRLFEFLLRPATREGEVSQSVIPISIEGLVTDTETGEFLFPERALVDRLRAGLAARDGIPIQTIQKEQEARLTGRTSRNYGTEQGGGTPKVLPEATSDVTTDESQAGNSKQQFRLGDGAYPESHSAKENPPHPTLDEKEQALLRFIVTNPEVPVNQVYKGIGVGVALGAKIRERLKAQGLVEELEIRTSSKAGGRPTKCLIPTFIALELFGKEAPTGRGGILHRHVQQVVAKGAIAKGYIARVEYTLNTGTIVDVHLEKGEQSIAVEIAIASLPEREINHMRNCLSVGYHKIYTIFADEHLLGRTAMAMQNAFSERELGKIRLLPLRHLAQVW